MSEAVRAPAVAGLLDGAGARALRAEAGRHRSAARGPKPSEAALLAAPTASSKTAPRVLARGASGVAFGLVGRAVGDAAVVREARPGTEGTERKEC